MYDLHLEDKGAKMFLRVEGGSIFVAPPTSDGFSVSLSLDGPEGEFVAR